MTAALQPHIPAAARLICVKPAHARNEHWEIEWDGLHGVGRAGRWYDTREAAVAMAESCGASDILDGPAHT